MGQNNFHKGHRIRLKTEFLARGFEGWSDHKILELLLCYAVPQGDTNPLAHRLIGQFGDLCGVLDAPASALLEVPGVGEHTATLLKLLPPLWGRYLSRGEERNTAVTRARDYYHLVVPYLMGSIRERLVILSLDSKCRPIGVDVISEGETDRVTFEERSLIRTVLARNAVAVVLAHNHVGADIRPSEEDRMVTMDIQNLLSRLQVELRDHLVVDGEQYLSMRDSGFIAFI